MRRAMKRRRAVLLMSSAAIMSAGYSAKKLALEHAEVPFSDVRILSAEISGQSITVTGTLVKHGCERIATTVYTEHDGVLRVADFSTAEAPGTPQSRPAAGAPQYFGPWTITARHPRPTAAAMFVTHQCESGTQQNLVFQVPWIGMEVTE